MQPSVRMLLPWPPRSFGQRSAPRWSETLNALVAVQAEDAVGIEILADVLGQLPGRPPCFAQGDLSDGNVAEQRDVDESSSTCRLDLAVADVVPDGEVHVQTMASRVPLW